MQYQVDLTSWCSCNHGALANNLWLQSLSSVSESIQIYPDRSRSTRAFEPGLVSACVCAKCLHSLAQAAGLKDSVLESLGCIAQCPLRIAGLRAWAASPLPRRRGKVSRVWSLEPKRCQPAEIPTALGEKHCCNMVRPTAF